MKTSASPLLRVSAIFLLLLVTALAVTYTKQNARVARMQIDPVYNAAGTATAVNCSAYLVARVVNDTNSADVISAPWVEVQYNLLDPALTGQTITAAGKTVTYPQLAALLQQANLDRATAAGVQ